MKKAQIFPNGRSQAVRIPKEFQFTGKEVYINRVGGVVMLVPCDAGWDVLVRSLEHFSDDFMPDRDQGEFQQRPPL